jgi:hypothetical protein
VNRTIQTAGLAAALVFFASACSREEVTHARVPKVAAPAGGQPGAAPGPMGGGSAPPGMQGDVDAPPRPEHGLAWTLPTGWKEERQGGMRYATLLPNVPGKADGSVVVLPGDAGGELANVNRWRGQIGLPALDQATLTKAKVVVKAKAGAIDVYDFTSEGQKKSRLIAGLLSADGSTWFIKLTGDAEAVTAARAGFLQLIGSLRLE